MNDKPKAQTMTAKPVVSVDEPRKLEVGFGGMTLSEGTLRSDHLLAVFLNFLEKNWPTKWEYLLTEYGITQDTDLERWSNPEVDTGTLDPHDGIVADRDQWERRHDDAASLLAECFDALDELAPDGFTFASHEGDGACYGFWSIKDPDDLLDEARDIAAEMGPF